jgi:hypothetical protein
MPYVHTDVLNNDLMHLPKQIDNATSQVGKRKHSHKNEMAYILRLDPGRRGCHIGKVIPD